MLRVTWTTAVCRKTGRQVWLQGVGGSTKSNEVEEIRGRGSTKILRAFILSSAEQTSSF